MWKHREELSKTQKFGLIIFAGSVVATSLFGPKVEAAVEKAQQHSTEVDDMSSPNKVAEYRKDGFPMPVIESEVKEGETTVNPIMDRLHVKPEDRHDVSQELQGQTGEYFNPGDPIDIQANDIKK